MDIVDIEKEVDKRKNKINKIIKISKTHNKEENQYIKQKIEKNYIDIETLYGNPRKMVKEISDFFEDVCKLLVDYLMDNREKTVGDLYKNFFANFFNEERAKALVNLLQPVNNRVYDRENIQSLKFSKSEILKGFKRETIEQDSANEILVKMLFWINKLTKLVEYKEINILKAKPMNIYSEDNYFNASKRVEILKLFRDNFDEETSNMLKKDYEKIYLETFGVSIEEDLQSIEDCEELKSIVYALKNSLMCGFMGKYFKAIKSGRTLGGIQAMGITKNEASLTDSVGSYMAVIRLKGYTTNIYLHTPSTCYAEAVDFIGANGLENKIPATVYSSVNPEKIIPINVICKVDKNSERYKLIKEEKEKKPDNQALKQAEQQIRCSKLSSAQMANWKNEKIEQIPVG